MRLSFLISFVMLCLWPLQVSAHWQSFGVLGDKLAGQTPQESGIDLSLPLVVDDGSAVTLKVAFNDTLETDEFITQLWILADKNPNPEVIDFVLGAQIPKVEMTTRIRLAESQTVYALAKSNLGRYWLTQQEVRVTVSGCLIGEENLAADTQMSQPRVALPRNPADGTAMEIRTMINHPMETGFREDNQGALIPQQLVDSLTVTLKGETVFHANFHTGTSANPFVTFFIDQFEDLTFTWTDQQGRQISEAR